MQEMTQVVWSLARAQKASNNNKMINSQGALPKLQKRSDMDKNILQ